ncbi:aminoacyl-tRNA hydrolase [candidate division KSB1 bacterium]|nr:aminoacyl-tRNA hydrolase [candidate division KSB1 bacterium]
MTIRINSELAIEEEEISYTASRSSGPGGQNVNKVSTRVTLWFNVDASPSLNAEQKETLKRELATRINKRGLLWIVSRQHRTQGANRAAALARFIELLRTALQPEAPRKPTRIPGSAKAKRLEQKRRRSRLKRERTQDYCHEA